jgi:RNA 2',3'-cyclic 3'-phosphodiesterase
VDGLRWTGPEQWHLTLRFLGEVEGADLTATRAAFRGISVKGRVTAELGPSTGRFGRRVLHAPVAGLEALAEATVEATAAVGKAPDTRPFAGHITLARARERRGVDLRALAGVPLAGKWTVGEVVLVASHLSGSGPARYEVVETLRLSG